MSRAGLISSIGPIMQISFVPEDFDAAIKHWTQTMGVGPFYMIEHAGLENQRFEGAPSAADFGVAIAYWGDIQIELIKQHNDVPSIYRTAPYAKSGLHHVCIITDDVIAAKEKAIKAGAKMAFEADVAGGGGVFYADAGGPQGLIEVLQLGPGADALFDMIKQASVDWDGKDPVRTLG